MKKDLETKDDELKSYKDDIKHWLKVNKLKYSWIAANLGKSEGTVRNWLYNPSLKVAEENKTLIVNLQRRHECGDMNVLYPDGKEFPHLSYVYLSRDAEKWLSLWLIAAEVEQESYDNGEINSNLAFANWIVNTLNNETRKILKSEQAQIQGLDMATIAGMIEGNLLTFDFMSVNQRVSQIRDTMDFSNSPQSLQREIEEEEKNLSLPIIKKRWNNNHFALAVALKKTNPYHFITETLTAAAQPDFMASLQAFIDEED